MIWPTIEEAIAQTGMKISVGRFIELFRIEGRVTLSFSGGRTSAFLLWCTLVAHGGLLPPDTIVVFANTGKEREETLRFVHECSARWGVYIWWVEWRPKPQWFEVVSFNSASRNGEVLEAKFREDKRLPNALTRTCTGETKRRTIRRLVKSEKRWSVFLTTVGLRYDEGPRVKKQEKENLRTRSKKTSPLAYAGVVKRTVMRFWLGDNIDPKNLRYPLPQGFDLGLRDDEGNCDMCFLKGVQKLTRLERDRPGSCDYWIAQEDHTGKRFERDWSYRDIKRWAYENQELPMEDVPDDDSECGDACYTKSSPAERLAEQREWEREMAQRGLEVAA